MGEVEETIKGYYDQYLNGIFAKIKPWAYKFEDVSIWRFENAFQIFKFSDCL
jgi:hypothetical protein